MLTPPPQQGADIIVHSATKWIAGNGANLGGVVVSSGKFGFKGNPRFPEFNQELPGFPGVVVTEEEGQDPVGPHTSMNELIRYTDMRFMFLPLSS